MIQWLIVVVGSKGCLLLVLLVPINEAVSHHIILPFKNTFRLLPNHFEDRNNFSKAQMLIPLARYLWMINSTLSEGITLVCCLGDRGRGRRLAGGLTMTKMLSLFKKKDS